ncbi:uncharacterized protein [Macrobrachium rosenbergii]|uniref:uncharacterized protein n=1 Tax=Macrobrachium rosenbergii TaxID=79674 RepID=UPI0034D62B30
MVEFFRRKNSFGIQYLENERADTDDVFGILGKIQANFMNIYGVQQVGFSKIIVKFEDHAAEEFERIMRDYEGRILALNNKDVSIQIVNLSTSKIIVTIKNAPFELTNEDLSKTLSSYGKANNKVQEEVQGNKVQTQDSVEEQEEHKEVRRQGQEDRMEEERTEEDRQEEDRQEEDRQEEVRQEEDRQEEDRQEEDRQGDSSSENVETLSQKENDNGNVIEDTVMNRKQDTMELVTNFNMEVMTSQCQNTPMSLYGLEGKNIEDNSSPNVLLINKTVADVHVDYKSDDSVHKELFHLFDYSEENTPDVLKSEDDNSSYAEGSTQAIKTELGAESTDGSDEYDIVSSVEILKYIVDAVKIKDVHNIRHRLPEYTFVRGNYAARLDRMYMQIDRNSVTETKTVPVSFSDHSCFLCDIRLPDVVQLGKSYWKLNCSVLTDTEIKENFKQKWTELQRKRDDYANILLWWDILVKEEVKKFYMKSCSIKKQQRFGMLNLLESRLRYLYEASYQTGNPNMLEINNVKKKIEEIRDEFAEDKFACEVQPVSLTSKHSDTEHSILILRTILILSNGEPLPMRDSHGIWAPVDSI